jgi:murein DD-endopeptidase MepM/ murein hydrolase activator NlpD
MRPIKLALLLTVAVFLLNTPSVFSQQTQQDPALASGHIEHATHAGECLNEEQRAQIMAEIAQSQADLKKRGLLPAPNGAEYTSFSWPLRQKAGVSDPSYYAIGNFVDEKPGTGIQDYNCGQYTYDGHKGTDIGIWPFPWTKMANNEVEVIAAAAGVIVQKADGNFDQNCSWNGQQWNAVYVQHPDGSVAWYGHVKKNSLTSKAVGASVAKGEYLGVVGSSGISTGPHLHFEVYSSTGTLIDPWGGPCNFMNGNSWWNPQHVYWDPKVCKIMTHSAVPTLPQCPPESVNASNAFQPGQTVYAAGYFRDYTANSIATYRLYRPDGSTAQTWTVNNPNNMKLAWWIWGYNLPANAQTGTWTFRVTYFNQTINHNFTVGVTCGTPSGFSTTNITTTTAKFNWNAVQGAVNYTVQLRWGGGNWGDLNGGPFSNNFVNVSGMTPGTTYEWRVRANCSGSQASAYSNSISFTTNGTTCGTPSGLSTSNITQVKASLSWNAVSGATSYTVQFYIGGTWTSLSPVTSNSVNVFGLYANSSYQWRVFATCSNGQSNPSAPTTFNTSSATNCTSGTQYPNFALNPSSNWQYQTLVWGGEYCVVNVTQGQVYTFSYCSSDGALLNFDGELSIRTIGNQLIMYSDDVCSQQPKLVWQAGFSGQVRVLLTKYSCQTQNTNSTMAYRIGGTPFKGDDPGSELATIENRWLNTPPSQDFAMETAPTGEQQASSPLAEERTIDPRNNLSNLQLQISPNPATEMVMVATGAFSEMEDKLQSSIIITDINGSIRQSRQNVNVTTDGLREAFDVSDLPAGVYIVQVRIGSMKGQRQLVKMK